MPVPITYYVNVSVTLQGAGTAAAKFGTPLFLNDHSSVDSAVLLGPYSSLSDVTDAGFSTSSPFYNWASAVTSQNPRPQSFYSGLLAAGDVTASLDAIEAFDPASWYMINMESRASADILDLAAWTESRRKLAMAQSNDPSLLDPTTGMSFSAQFGGTPTDGDYDLIFTGFGLGSPVTVTVTRAAGTPATNDDLAAAMETALDTAEAGPLNGVLVTGSPSATTDTVVFDTVDGLIGTVTTAAPGAGTLTATVTDADIGSQLFANQYTRTALVYNSSDTVYLDGAWTSRCLGFDLDVKKGVWAYKQLNGVSGSTLTNAQAQALRNVNANYFAAAQATSGLNTPVFTAQGWVPFGTAGAGRRIDVMSTLDLTHARFEEDLINVLLRETHGVPYDDAGINRFVAAIKDRFSRLVAAGHYTNFIVPEGQPDAGTLTPSVTAPLLSETTTSERASRTLTIQGLAYLRSGIERVVFSVEVRE